MVPDIRSLHHVTATVNDAQEDLDFYCRLLGLRLVKKTVNFDNRGVYHFYYGDRTGTPGTIMTTFPYKGRGVPAGRKGAGQITAIGFSVPPGGLDRWRSRLRSRRVSTGEATRFGEEVIGFSDPSGLTIELIGSAGDAREPWTIGEVDEGMAIRGIHSLELTIAAPDRSLALFSSLLGLTVLDSEGSRTRIGMHGGGPGRTLDILAAPGTAPALNGLGTVHHLALAVATAEDQLAYREAVIARGIPVTEVLDRQYFQSIYFREPGGVLLEIATISPGFLVDESAEDLGQSLRLPPWEAANRAAIEAALPAVYHP
ncbi:MAG TPA: VOC family protein [Gemmatimonadales bacterium]|nr:VOC family protein [Gemmatimonadales bacterium]